MKKFLIVLCIVGMLLVFLSSFVVIGFVSNRESAKMSYFRTNFYHDTIWEFGDESVAGHLSVVLSNVANWKPRFLKERFGEKLSEQEIPLLLQFFTNQGWEVVSHDSELIWIAGGDTTYCDLTVILRRQNENH